MKLPINTLNALTNGLQYAYPFAILSAYKEAIPWIAENYIYISLFEPLGVNQIANYMGYIDGYTYTNDARANSILVSTPLDTYILQKHDVIEVVLHYLNNGFYIVVFVDEYFLPSCGFYNKKHMLHEQLLYGVDEGTKSLYALGFNQSGVFSKLTHSFEDISIAYREGLSCRVHGTISWAEGNRIICIKPAERLYMYHFSWDSFQNKVKCYLRGRVHDTDLYYADWCGIGEFIIGISYSERLIVDTNIEPALFFRRVHHLWEHKARMLDSIQYLVYEKKTLSTEYTRTFTDKVLIPIDILRNRILKCILLDHNIPITQITEGIKSVMDNEVAILNRIIGN